MKRTSLFVRKDREGLHLPTRDMGLLRAVDYRFFYFLPCTDLSFLIFSTMTMHFFIRKRLFLIFKRMTGINIETVQLWVKKKKERKNYIGKSDSKSANILVSGPRLSLRSSSDKDRARGEIMGKLVMFLELRDNYADTL